MNQLQHKASDPSLSTWVLASAGTGKTKILTDRVLRLLLANEDANKILCLTFTNAAATEMEDRINSALEHWSKIDHDSLHLSLKIMLGRLPTKEETKFAKSLYIKYLTSEKKVGIYTIHSFCQKLLQTFPIEAGIKPSFKIIDETKATQILNQIKTNLLSHHDIRPLAEYVWSNFHQTIIDEILEEIIQQKMRFDSLDINYDTIAIEFQRTLKQLQNINSAQYDFIRNNVLVQNIAGFNLSHKKLKDFFLTQNGDKKKRIVTKKVAEPGSNLYSDLELIQDHIYELDQKEKLLKFETHSKILSLIAKKILHEYSQYKDKHGFLDYDDLILHSYHLLNDQASKDWVLYKLDGGINHLLVDEAQDTSPYQWKIIEALIQEFYSGSQERSGRTVFVVGDEKQSIFSFQGANVSYFTKMNEYIKSKMLSGGKTFEDVFLQTSYRSSTAIIDVVQQVFSGLHLFPTVQKITSHRNYEGSVELWPISTTEKTTEEFWPIMQEQSNLISAKMKLAHSISSYIKKLLDSQIVLAATNKVISPGDFMILFRKRDQLTAEVIKALEENGLPSSGLDRINFENNLIIQTLISIGKFVLDHNDDLNLASLLKSEIFKFSEEILYNISINRNDLSIWQYIQNESEINTNYNKACSSLKIFIELYSGVPTRDFFLYLIDIIGLRYKFSSGHHQIIDEFLNIFHDYNINNDPSLQNFIFWLEESKATAKREIDESDRVRIMTIHASKGLQAPIVIMCDTTGLPSNNSHFIWDEEGNFYATKSNADSPEFFIKIKDKQQQNTFSEYLRLLYVGMTRAEDHLVICGFSNTQKEVPENCWYNIVNESMQKMAKELPCGKMNYGIDTPGLLNNNSVENTATNIKYFYPKIENLDCDGIFKNHSSDLIRTSSTRKFGLIFHKILEDTISAGKITNMLGHPLIKTLDEINQRRINNSISRILDNKELIDLLSNKVICELPIGTIDKNSINNETTSINRIDLAIFATNNITIIDYKSDQIVPKTTDNVPNDYLKQLTKYRYSMTKIYPEKEIITKILWLENGSLMSIN